MPLSAIPPVDPDRDDLDDEEEAALAPIRTETGDVDVFAYLTADAEQVTRLAAILDAKDGDQ